MTYPTQIQSGIWRITDSFGTFYLVSASAALRFSASGQERQLTPSLAGLYIGRISEELRHNPATMARLLDSFGAPASFRPVPHAEMASLLLRYVALGRAVVFRAPISAARLSGSPIAHSATTRREPEIRQAPANAEKAQVRRGTVEAGPQLLGFGRIDPVGKDGLFKSINSKNPSRHGYAYEHGRNAADLRHAKDCLACQKYREPKIMGDVRDGKCGVDAILVDGTMVQRKSYRRLPGLRTAILKQVESDLRRYGNRANPDENWRGGRDGSALNGCIEFQIDLDRLLRRPAQPAVSAKTKAPIQYPNYTREYVTAWCGVFERELNALYSKPVNGKTPSITVRPLSAGERSCPLARAKGGAA